MTSRHASRRRPRGDGRGRAGQLTIHPTKTALIQFRKPASKRDSQWNSTFDFWDTHYWDKSRQTLGHQAKLQKQLRRAMKSLALVSDTSMKLG
jgi:hypothetical protein